MRRVKRCYRDLGFRFPAGLLRLGFCTVRPSERRSAYVRLKLLKVRSLEAVAQAGNLCVPLGLVRLGFRRQHPPENAS